MIQVGIDKTDGTPLISHRTFVDCPNLLATINEWALANGFSQVERVDVYGSRRQTPQDVLEDSERRLKIQKEALERAKNYVPSMEAQAQDAADDLARLLQAIKVYHSSIANLEAAIEKDQQATNPRNMGLPDPSTTLADP